MERGVVIYLMKRKKTVDKIFKVNNQFDLGICTMQRRVASEGNATAHQLRRNESGRAAFSTPNCQEALLNMSVDEGENLSKFRPNPT
jgi:hypothetical protein